VPDPSTYRPAPGTIPEDPGVYKFRDERGRVIYVGKAKNLRQRLNSYFADLHAMHARTRQMVTSAASVEWTVVSTEVEALQLEYTWIQQFDPRFNVRYRDDKSYPSLAVTLYEEYPRLQVMRGAKRKGVRYFGPYAHAWAIRETLDLLLRVFPARTCSAGVFKRAGQIGRPCLLGYIGKCSAPCVGRVTAEEHRAIVDDFVDFMAGKTDLMIRRLEREMAAASAELEFERAARIRDDIGALRRAMEKQAVVFGDGTDADVVAFAEDALEAAVQVFHVRGGRVRGQRGWVVDKVEDVTTGDLVEQFCLQVYGADSADDAADSVPREILVPELPPDREVLEQLLRELRGARVTLRVPQRGDKRALLETVARNAQQAFMQHKLKRATDLTARSQALAELQDALGLDTAPLRIECFDVSHVQGTNVVASMVVFEDGLPRKSEYRRFAIRGTGVRSGADWNSAAGSSGIGRRGFPADGARAEGGARGAEPPEGGDVQWIQEAVRRRMARYLDERIDTGEEADDAQDDEGDPTASPVAPQRPSPLDPETGRPRKFAYPPNLLVVDGGAPQVAAAAAALAELGIEDVALCGLAKRLEEVWLPGETEPVILPRTSEALYLLQRVRDEAHRFAITYHRQKRSRAMTTSALDGVPGLGESRKKALLTRFGSLKRLRAASVEDIMAVPGVGRRTAEAVAAALHREDAQPGPAVDPITGEVLDG
jgi:excinuclease ABC subunit C